MSDSSPHPLFETEDWIFDLDNTLYPHEANLFAQIDVRMGAFISDLLGLGPDEARILQKDYFYEHGTTLNGLMLNHEVDPHDYLKYVHDIDLSVINPDPALDEALSSLSGRKLIYTNGSEDHARRVLDQLGIAAHFEGIFDVLASDFVPKPDHSAMELMVEQFNIRPSQAVMVEDLARNLGPARRLGMTTVWVNTGYQSPAHKFDPDIIDYEIELLTPWLCDVAGVGRQPD
ncbi:MAG: pyrimidine 5'-nucleotidase [Alphaproteobacteria bacterium]|nr:pyrimidine 5'-nucleotidase [Alphaproteobacteria bacterium]